MRLLIIGGTQFIGPHVARHLYGQGHDITVFHRGEHEAALPPGIRHVRSPLASVPVQRFPDVLTRPAPDAILHMFPVGEADAQALMARFTGIAGRVVGISSGDVYRAYGRVLGLEPGPPEPGSLSETAALRQVFFPHRHRGGLPGDWTHSYEKILVEHVLLGNPALPGTILRLPAVYGPGDPHRRLRPYVKRMLDGRRRILVDARLAAWRWSHGYVENVAHAIALAVTSEHAVGRVYNVAEAGTPTMAERIRGIGRLLAWDGEVIAMPAAQLPPHLHSALAMTQDLIMNTDRIRRDLGYHERVDMDRGLEHTIAWERDQPPAPDDPGAAQYQAEDAV